MTVILRGGGANGNGRSNQPPNQTEHQQQSSSTNNTAANNNISSGASEASENNDEGAESILPSNPSSNSNYSTWQSSPTLPGESLTKPDVSTLLHFLSANDKQKNDSDDLPTTDSTNQPEKIAEFAENSGPYTFSDMIAWCKDSVSDNPTSAEAKQPQIESDSKSPEENKMFSADSSTFLNDDDFKNNTGHTISDEQCEPSSSTETGFDETGCKHLTASDPSDDASDVNLVSFPFAELTKLDQMISWPRWIIPVLPKGQLEVLLQAAINLAKKGLDNTHPACQRFYREGLTISFTRLLNDEAVNGWKLEIHKCIYLNCEKLIELIVLKLGDDCFPLLDLLAMVFNPSNKFHMYNMNRLQNVNIQAEDEEKDVYAALPDSRCLRGWLISLINKFGSLGGFQKLLDRFMKGPPLTVPLIAALLKPFGLCYEYLAQWTVETYFLSTIEYVPNFLASLSDEELKRESKNEAKNDVLSGIVKSLKNLASRVPNQDERIRELEIFRLKMILRLLQISSFNGKMNALNEVNKVIASVGYNSHRHPGSGSMPSSTDAGGSAHISLIQTPVFTMASTTSTSESVPLPSIGPSSSTSQLALVEEEDWLTAERLAEWIRENRVLQVVLKDSLHQPQYVEKLEKILRFSIKEKALTLQDLDDLWAAQSGKHEAIVKNMHDLLAKLAWDFSPEQLDHLFECFRSSWTKANKKQRERLLELIRRLAEDDKDGVMANKVLNLFWNLAHDVDIPTDIMDQALAAHVKILDYSCCQDRDSQKTEWLDKCVEELKKEDSDWVLPALKLIREICCLYNEAPANFSGPDSSNVVWVPRIMLYQDKNQRTATTTTTTTTAAVTTTASVTTTVTATTTSATTGVDKTHASQRNEPEEPKKILFQTILASSETDKEEKKITESTVKSRRYRRNRVGDTTITNEEKCDLIFQDFYQECQNTTNQSGDKVDASITNEVHGVMYRHHVIDRLQHQHSLVVLVSENLSNYMKKARQLAHEKCNEFTAHSIPLGKKYSHAHEVQERLNFLRFLLKDGRLWLCTPQAKQVWKCLAENAIFAGDRESCFRWFSQLMSEEQDLDPEMNRSFFETNILQLDASLVTEIGIECFDKFFKAVNLKEGKFILKKQEILTEDLELIGLDYLWRILLNCDEDVVNSAINLIKGVYTDLGPSLESHQVDIHNELIDSCVHRLQAAYDTVSVLKKDETAQARVLYELSRMSRILQLLYSYIQHCDNLFGDERNILPLNKAVRGEQVSLTIRFPVQIRHLDDIHLWTHRNEYISVIKKQILSIIKANNMNMKIDLYYCEDGFDGDGNREEKLATELPDKDELVLNAKLYQASMNAPTSPDSSSDSSPSSPSNVFDKQNLVAENSLPGVILSREHKYVNFFFQLSDLGMLLNHESLRETALSILNVLPPDVKTVESLQILCATRADNPNDANLACFEELFYRSSPTKVLYSLKIIHSLLMPSRNPLSEDAQVFQYNFMKSGCGLMIIELLKRNNFISSATDRARIIVYNAVLRISELVLTCIGHYLILSSSSSQSPSSVWFSALPQYNGKIDIFLNILRGALEIIPHPLSASKVREVALQTAQHLVDKESPAFKSMIAKSLPDLGYVKSVMVLCWATVTGKESALNEDIAILRKMVVDRVAHQTNSLVYTVCKRGLGILTLMLMLSPSIMNQLIVDASWHHFIIDVLLICQERSIRITAKEQFALIANKCALNGDVLISFIKLLHQHLGSTVSVDGYYDTSDEFFYLFCKLLSHARNMRCPLPQAHLLFDKELDLLYNVKTKLVKNGVIVETLLEGHLGIVRELIYYLKLSPKSEFEKWAPVLMADGDDVDNRKYKKELIKLLVDDYIFTPSRAMVMFQKMSQSNVVSPTSNNRSVLSHSIRSPYEEVDPICTSSSTLTAAYDCLVALCTDCIPNLRYLGYSLLEMYHSAYEQPISDWEFQPPIGPRPAKGFVGLKNAGATCYMNSVFQQLYMIPEIRSGLLSVEGASNDVNEDFSDEEKSIAIIPSVGLARNTDEDSRKTVQELRKEYNLGVLKYTQEIFGHLVLSKLQYYVPRGFWKHFKLWGEPVNLREQHDALEFFNSLVDSIDEALKTLGYPPIMTKVLGGSFADQKICKECPHRYSREEPFTTLNIDIRNHSNLFDSLEQYVKGDLLEGANAYHCEKCNRKVETVKRLCIKKLPPVLAIQLKRFDYDFERSCAIKFNDYFEFPRVLDMEPYTVNGLAKIEGEIIEEDLVVCEDFEINQSGRSNCTRYELCGIVVHSGQASGGHYYSYILHKNADSTRKWYKFDDGDVSECKLDDDEEMKIQCFGGEYMGEVFDQMLKRMSCRRQKRWWNAYILVYRRVDTQENEITTSLTEMSIVDRSSNSQNQIKMPLAIKRSVQRQNIKFMHIKNQFSSEYFQFMNKLLNSNGQVVLSYCQRSESPTRIDSNSDIARNAEDIALICVQLASKFLFQTCFHTKKTLRGSALDWAEILNLHFRASSQVRAWFVHNELFLKQYRFSEYLLECPNSDVRSAFAKLVVFLAHFALHDGDCKITVNVFGANSPVNAGAELSDGLLRAVLLLLNKEVTDHSRHLTQYFNLFYQYALIGSDERSQLLDLNVPGTFILVALDEGPGPPIKYQYADLAKLYQVVSLLVRSCDVSSKCVSYYNDQPPLPNPYGTEELGKYLRPLQPQVYESLYQRSFYVKKIIDDANASEDTIKLLRFCCWENPKFSSAVLTELLWQIEYTYAYELRPHLDLTYHILMIGDSWQQARIQNALRGPQEEKDGLFDTIQRNKSHYQKRAYQCIKMLVNLFSHSPVAHKLLQNMPDAKKKWIAAVSWLNEELERRSTFQQAINQYAYNWSPPAQSNEISNGYYLERSNSAKLTLSKAIELCPPEEKDEIEDQEMSDDVEPISESPPTSIYSLPFAPARYSVEEQSNERLCVTSVTTAATTTTTTTTTTTPTQSITTSTTTSVTTSTSIDSNNLEILLRALSNEQKSEKLDFFDYMAKPIKKDEVE